MKKVNSVGSPCFPPGLTMLEVILVIMIVAIATAMVAPGLIQSLSNYELSTEAKKLRSKIRYTQQLAIAAQNNYQIYFDTVNEIARVYYENPDKENEFIELKDKILELPLELEKNIGIDRTDFPSDTFCFDYSGSPVDVDGVDVGGTLWLSDSSGNSKTISIEAATGKVTIE